RRSIIALSATALLLAGCSHADPTVLQPLGNTPSQDATSFSQPDHGRHFTILYSFDRLPDSAYPQGDLIRDSGGNLYGTAVLGGGSEDGNVFEIDPSGHETVLHTFDGFDGKSPVAGLVRDAVGDLYGTTAKGGPNSCGSEACGLVFELSPSGVETIIHSFGGADGAYPRC